MKDKLHTYATREAALRSKSFVAQSTGRSVRDLVVVRHGDGYAIRTRESLERWISRQRRR